MSQHFKITGAEALLAIAACERTTTLMGFAETKPGQNATFAYGAVGRLLPGDVGHSSGNESSNAHLSVEVQRVLTRPGVYRYQCTIQPNENGILS